MAKERTYKVVMMGSEQSEYKKRLQEAQAGKTEVVTGVLKLDFLSGLDPARAFLGEKFVEADAIVIVVRQGNLQGKEAIDRFLNDRENLDKFTEGVQYHVQEKAKKPIPPVIVMYQEPVTEEFKVAVSDKCTKKGIHDVQFCPDTPGALNDMMQNQVKGSLDPVTRLEVVRDTYLAADKRSGKARRELITQARKQLAVAQDLYGSDEGCVRQEIGQVTARLSGLNKQYAQRSFSHLVSRFEETLGGENPGFFAKTLARIGAVFAIIPTAIADRLPNSGRYSLSDLAKNVDGVIGQGEMIRAIESAASARAMKPLIATAGQGESHGVSPTTEALAAEEEGPTPPAQHQNTRVTKDSFTIQTAQGQKFEITRDAVKKFFNGSKLQTRANLQSEPPTADQYFEDIKEQAQADKLTGKAVDALAVLTATKAKEATGKLETASSESAIQDLADDYFLPIESHSPGQ